MYSVSNDYKQIVFEDEFQTNNQNEDLEFLRESQEISKDHWSFLDEQYQNHVIYTNINTIDDEYNQEQFF